MKRIIIPLLILLLASCAELTQVVNKMDTNRPLTQNEVVSGLKQALKIGADSASSILSVKNGYYRDQLVKITLPPEAETVTKNISRLPGGEKLVEDVILRINRSAEAAAKEAAPVFARAITEMTIQDGFEILGGKKDAATQYLKQKTYKQLYQLYQPKIKKSLDREIVGNISTNESWESLAGQWNKIAGSFIGEMADLKEVETQLDQYLTDKALEGLFIKLALEEAKIRNDPAARVTDLLKRVFG
ncbi:DUF4197 domain-containing protein [Marinilabilia rubra]|uniref:DUF4197 domain-containing protein n=1 Tax=Marinilabilia rubra TaxID=2162893 RepID=A0A2U2BC75_9BACT|nr:DUF4197 domain-containing protein [Marinilabilia rubra]PWE00669.1 DUF4197 domain-containing protein [Marinilabilia rubra]